MLQWLKTWRSNRRLDRQAKRLMTREQRQVFDIHGVPYRFWTRPLRGEDVEP